MDVMSSGIELVTSRTEGRELTNCTTLAAASFGSSLSPQPERLACVVIAYERLGPFLRGKIRRELYHLYEHVLSKTRTARINGSRLISVLDSFSCECCP